MALEKFDTGKLVEQFCEQSADKIDTKYYGSEKWKKLKEFVFNFWYKWIVVKMTRKLKITETEIEYIRPILVIVEGHNQIWKIEGVLPEDFRVFGPGLHTN